MKCPLYVLGTGALAKAKNFVFKTQRYYHEDSSINLSQFCLLVEPENHSKRTHCMTSKTHLRYQSSVPIKFHYTSKAPRCNLH